MELLTLVLLFFLHLHTLPWNFNVPRPHFKVASVLSAYGTLAGRGLTCACLLSWTSATTKRRACQALLLSQEEDDRYMKQSSHSWPANSGVINTCLLFHFTGLLRLVVTQNHVAIANNFPWVWEACRKGLN